jgi:3-dehydroquinate synthase
MHGATLRESLARSFGSAAVIRIGDGERFKNHDTLLKIYEGLFRAQADRRSWILAFGGGVVGDIAGFAAATFMRGIPYASVPTTLLAQVDSSIGGKVGINVRRGKNLIGAFHQPSAVLSDTDILATLSNRELASGLYEVVKCGAMRSASLLWYIDRHLAAILARRPGPLEHVILESSRIKAEVVSGDEREDDLRMILNYGHTVGHALEAATFYKRFRHGEAVAWGMIAAVGFGRELGMLNPGEAERLIKIVHRVADLPSLKGIRLSALWGALKRDKKFRAGSIRMVLLPRLGVTEIVSRIDPTHLKRFLRTFLEAEGHVIQGCNRRGIVPPGRAEKSDTDFRG